MPKKVKQLPLPPGFYIVRIGAVFGHAVAQEFAQRLADALDMEAVIEPWNGAIRRSILPKNRRARRRKG